MGVGIHTYVLCCFLIPLVVVGRTRAICYSRFVSSITLRRVTGRHLHDGHIDGESHGVRDEISQKAEENDGMPVTEHLTPSSQHSIN